MKENEYIQHRHASILHAELLSALWHTMFIDITQSKKILQLRQYSPFSYLRPDSYFMDITSLCKWDKGQSVNFRPKRHDGTLLLRWDHYMTKINLYGVSTSNMSIIVALVTKLAINSNSVKLKSTSQMARSNMCERTRNNS